MKKIVFLTATRADYGKLKSAIFSIQENKAYKTYVFVTGMHNLSLYGNTYEEIRKDKVKNITRFSNQNIGDNHSKILSKTVLGFSKYVKKINPDLVIVHGDRIEPLACAIVSCLNNIKIGHFEGGELSGTVDEIFRHSISKLCNIHFVTNKVAKKRLIQMGEVSSNIFVVGSPDVDLILSKNLPSLQDAKVRYNIDFNSFSIAIFHSVTTDLKNLKLHIISFIKALKLSRKKFILIYPNNDLGSNIIINEYKKIKDKNIRIFPSLRFEYYLTFLKNCEFIIGNSSSGIMEAPYYGTPTINLGNRQNQRAKLKSIINCEYECIKILNCIKKISKVKKFEKSFFFGLGNSNDKFLNALRSKRIWNLNNQKIFKEVGL